MKQLTVFFFLQLGISFLGYSQFSKTNRFKFDLEQIKSVDFENKKIVAIGEATHNSHEEALVKNEIAKYLITKKGYSYILLEAYDNGVKPLNNFILGKIEVKDIKRWLLNTKQLYWIWQTEEFIELLVWLREHNSNTKNKVQIIGVDSQKFKKDNVNRDSLMANAVIEKTLEDEGKKAILLAHNAHIALSNIVNFTPTGFYLNNIINEAYYPIGIVFNKGSFNAMIKSKHYSMDTVRIRKPLKGGIYRLWKNQGMPSTMFFDLSQKKVKTLSKKTKFWLYGAIHGKRNSIYHKNIFTECYSGLIYINQLSSASNLMMPGNYFAVAKKQIPVNNTLINKIKANINAARGNKADTATINFAIRAYKNKKLVSYKESFIHPEFDSKDFQLEMDIEKSIDLIIVSALLIGEDKFTINSISANIEKEGTTEILFIEDFTGNDIPDLEFYTKNFNKKIENGSLVIKRKSSL